MVEEPQNVNVIEKTGGHRGGYHVLMGAISPLQGVGPDDLKIKGLLAHRPTGVEEIILATNPTVEGEATAIYLARLLKPLGVRVTRIAMGIPVGSDLDYADDLTMTRRSKAAASSNPSAHLCGASIGLQFDRRAQTMGVRTDGTHKSVNCGVKG